MKFRNKINTPKSRSPKLSQRSNGESNPRVFSYYASGVPANKQASQRSVHSRGDLLKGHKFKLILIPTYIATIAIIAAVIYSCWLQSSPRIVTKTIPGTVYRTNEEYQQRVLSAWNNSWFNHIKFFVDRDALETELQNELNELKSVQINIPLLGSKATVILTPEKPSHILTNSKGTYYVNYAGKIMSRTTEVQQNDIKSIPTINDETGSETSTGKYVLSESATKFLTILHKQISAEGLIVQSIILPKAAANEVDVRLEGKHYYIKFQIGSDPRQAVGSYLAASKRIESENINISEYIDVRVEEKVFFK